MDGLKTGYTKTAGYCLTATMKKDDMRLIATVMGEPDASTRNKEISKMLDYGFNQYKINNVIKKNDIIKKVNISKAKDDSVNVISMQDVNLLSKKADKNKPSYKLKIKNLTAPIKKGEIVGTLKLKNNGKLVQEIDLTVDHDIKKANIIQLYFKNLKNTFSGHL